MTIWANGVTPPATTVAACGSAPTTAWGDCLSPPATVWEPCDSVPPDPPAAPTVLAATDVTTDGFTANWSAVESATGYRLDVSTGSDFGSYVAGYENLAVEETSAAVTGLDDGTEYFYRVRAENAGGTSDNSDTASVTTDTAIVTPTLAGYELWLDAQQESAADMDPFPTFTDRSGFGRHFTLPTGGPPWTAPTYRAAVLNGLPGIHFNGSTDQLEALATPFLAGPQTLLAIFRWHTTPGATHSGLLAFSKGLTGYSYGYRAAGFNTATVYPNGSLFPASGVALQTVPTLLGIHARPTVGAGNNGTRVWINGIGQAPFSTICVPLNAAKVALGVLWSEQSLGLNARPGPVEIGEVLWYPFELTEAQHLDLYTNYFKPKWGLA